MANLAQFLERSEEVGFDQEHREKINFNMYKYQQSVDRGLKQFKDLELARKKAKNIKHKAISSLDTYLLEFEKNFTANGGKVIWASTAEEAIKEILQIARENQVQKAVKSKSMVTEELELNAHLEKAGIEILETDLGEYIVQLAGEKPYHIVTPAMHKSKQDVAEIFHEKLGTPINLTPKQLTEVAREKLRNKYLEADIGFTGANFLIADTGAVAITENEGNARLTATFPRIHIAIAGIEKILPSIMDLSLFWPLLSTHGTGQQVTVYNSLVAGPKRESETDGPEQMYVILLDNGRTNVLADTRQRESLYCIRCGACLNVCPVYKNIGGHTYDTPYSGPIGAVLNPNLKSQEEYGHLSYASSLCGNCTEVCPVRIDLHNMLVHNRKKYVEEGLSKSREKRGWRFWRRGMMKRKVMNTGSARIKQFVFKTLFKKTWGKRRTLPEFSKQSFNQWWKDERGG